MRKTCCACQSHQIQTIETVSTKEIAKVWLRTDSEAGEAIINYVNLGIMPDTVHIDQCTACGLGFANPGWAADAQWYSKIEKYGMRWEFSQCLKDLGSNRPTILEVGCGEGYFLEFASSNGYNIVGLDFNQAAIEVARAKGMEAYNWNFKEIRQHLDRQFGAVAFFHVIEHLEEPEAFFSELAEIMPSGSTLHLSCPGPRRFTTDLETENRVGLRDMWDYPPLHQTRWNQKASEKILSRFGWHLTKYVEEPFYLRGISTFLATKDLILKGVNPSELSPIALKIKILQKLLQIFIPASIKQYKGMSMYCMAVRK